MSTSRETHREEAARLGAELEAALLRELRSAYEDLNHCFFRRRLGAPAFALSDATTRLGRWIPAERTLEMSRRLLLTQPWGVVVEVLKHEMAHQFVHEVLGKHEESAHGPAFRELCEKLGFDGSAAGMPAAATQSSEDARILERIGKLLALAESANVNEAQAAMSAAQRLMLKHNLETIADPKRSHAYGFRHLGNPTGRVNEAERLLGAILKHFFVEVIWVPVYRVAEGKRGTVLEVCGTPANLEMAAYVHAFLTHTSEALWRTHKRERRIRGDRDRRTFLAGVMIGFLEQLNAQRAVNKQQGLVWVGDADLESFYRRRHPRIVQIRNVGQRRTEAHHHGREAGRKIVLHKPVSSGPSGGPKLLGR